jgi:hypothetical protein
MRINNRLLHRLLVFQEMEYLHDDVLNYLLYFLVGSSSLSLIRTCKKYYNFITSAEHYWQQLIIRNVGLQILTNLVCNESYKEIYLLIHRGSIIDNVVFSSRMQMKHISRQLILHEMLQFYDGHFHHFSLFSLEKGKCQLTTTSDQGEAIYNTIYGSTKLIDIWGGEIYWTMDKQSIPLPYC